MMDITIRKNLKQILMALIKKVLSVVQEAETILHQRITAVLINVIQQILIVKAAASVSGWLEMQVE